MSRTKFKIILVGDFGTGKSSFLEKVSSNSPSKETVIVSHGFSVTLFSLDSDNGSVDLSIWDSTGQEQNGQLHHDIYAGADAAYIFFDVHSKESYENVEKWHKEITTATTTIPIILFGNKTDLPEWEVSRESIKYHHQHSNMYYFEGSVKENVEVHKSLNNLVQILLQKPVVANDHQSVVYPLFSAPNPPPPTTTVKSKKEKGCCDGCFFCYYGQDLYCCDCDGCGDCCDGCGECCTACGECCTACGECCEGCSDCSIM